MVTVLLQYVDLASILAKYFNLPTHWGLALAATAEYV